MQELQVMNIQMRIITEDNIEQFDSMAYGKTVNIDFDKLPEDSKLLIVDDKIDTGNTINYVKERIGNKFKLVRYATLFAEKSVKNKVDHYGVLVPDETWIDFPWE